MKKVISISLLVAAMAMMLTACGKFKCDVCSSEKSGKKYETDIFGEELVICEDCYNTISNGFE